MKMSDPLQQTLFPAMELDGLMSSRVGSHAKTLAMPESGPGWAKEPAHGYSPKSSALLASYDRNSSSWRTLQLCFLAQVNGEADGLAEFSETWPNAGMMRNGKTYLQQPWARHTLENASGLLPTPSGTSNHGNNHVSGRLDEWGGSSNPWRGTEIGRTHSPSFEGWMMGYPAAWHQLTDIETPSSPKSRK